MIRKGPKTESYTTNINHFCLSLRSARNPDLVPKFSEIWRALRQQFCLFAVCIGQKRPFLHTEWLSVIFYINYWTLFLTFLTLRQQFCPFAAGFSCRYTLLLGCCISAPLSCLFSMRSKERASSCFLPTLSGCPCHYNWSMVWWHPVSRHVLIMDQSLGDVAT